MAPAFELPAVMDLAAAGPLHAALLARRGADLDLDGSSVERLGGLGLQILLCARRSWAQDGFALRLCDPAPPLVRQLALMGAADRLA